MNNEELIKGTSLFTKIDDSKFSELIDKIEEVNVPAGKLFIKEGDRAEALYIVKEGVLQVFTTRREGKDVILSRLETGSFFGEQALLSVTPGLRSASIRTLSDTTLLKLKHEPFLNLLESDKYLKGELEKLGFQQLLGDLQAIGAEYDISKHLFEKETIYQTKEFDDGETIISQGDPSEGAYFLVSGSVDVFEKNDQGINKFICSLNPNQLFGESGIILNRPRQATVSANGHVKTLFIPSDKFHELYRTIPELKAIADTLHNVYQSPERGEVTRHVGLFVHLPAVIAKFRLKDGREVISSNVIGKNIQSIRDSKAQNPTTLFYEDKATHRELHLEDKLLVGVTSYGEWSAVQELYSRVLNKETLSDEEIEHFKETGDLILTKKITDKSDDEIICNCMYVSRGSVKACIQEGNTTIDDVSEQSGAGSICGACIPEIQTMLGHNSWQAMHLIKIDEMTPDVRTYKLLPIQQKQLKRFLPGQHIVIQCEINGHWVERAYTLTSTPENNEFYEIAVKREPSGLFSTWLFENETSVPFVRVSHPSGEFTFDTTLPAKMICFTAGIGITPAVSFARAIYEAKSKRPLLIFSTARNKDLLAYGSELDSLSSAQVECIKHFTEEKGRVQPQEIEKLALKDPNAEFFICGPKEFETMVKTTLLQAGITEDRIFIEQFTSATAPA